MKIIKGTWSTGVKRELYFTDIFPTGNITSISSYCYNSDEIYLTKNKRGWEIPCGHLEEGENSIDALKRETFEEVGGKILNHKYIGYYKVYFNGGINYCPIYLSKTEIISKPTGEEILDTIAVNDKNILEYLGNPDLYNSLKKYNYL